MGRWIAFTVTKFTTFDGMEFMWYEQIKPSNPVQQSSPQSSPVIRYNHVPELWQYSIYMLEQSWCHSSLKIVFMPQHVMSLYSSTLRFNFCIYNNYAQHYSPRLSMQPHKQGEWGEQVLPPCGPPWGFEQHSQSLDVSPKTRNFHNFLFVFCVLFSLKIISIPVCVNVCKHPWLCHY